MFNMNKESSVMRHSDESMCSEGNKIAFVDSKKVCPKMFIESESTLGGHEQVTKNASCSFNDAFSAFITQKTTKRPLDIDDTDYIDDVAPINSKIARVESKPQTKSMILKNHQENKIRTLSKTGVPLDVMKPCENGVLSGGGIPANINNTATTESLLNFIAKSTKSIKKVVADTNGTRAEKEKRFREVSLAEKERSFREACNALANLSKKNIDVDRDVGNNQFVTRNESKRSQVDRNGVIEGNIRANRSCVNRCSSFNPGPNTRVNNFTNISHIPASAQSQINNCKSINTCKQSGNNFVANTNQYCNNLITRATTNGTSFAVNTVSTVSNIKTAVPVDSVQNCRRSSLRRKSVDVWDTSLLGSSRNIVECTSYDYKKHNATRAARTSSILYPSCQLLYVSLERLTLEKVERIKNQLKKNYTTFESPHKFESPRKKIDVSVDPPAAVARCSELPVIINDCSSDSFQIPDYIVADLEADLLLNFEENNKSKSEKIYPSRKRLSTINSQTSSLPEHCLYEEEEEVSLDSTEFNQSLAAAAAVLSDCKKSKKKKSELILPISSKKLNETRLAGEYVPNFMTHDECCHELRRNAIFPLSEWWLNDYGECTDITSMISNVTDWYKMDESWRKKKLVTKKNLFLEKFDDCASKDSFLSTDLGDAPKINDTKSTTVFSFKIDEENCLFDNAARASQCQEAINKIENLFHSSKSSTTLLQFCLPDKRMKKCYMKLVSRGRKIKTTNSSGENELEESIQCLDTDHFLKSLSLYALELSLHEILWPPELLANRDVHDMDVIQSESPSDCEIKLAEKSEVTLTLPSEIKPHAIQNDNIENESKEDKTRKRPRIKKVVVYESIGSDGMIVSLPKPVKCSVKKPASARVKKSDIISSVIGVTSQISTITNNEHIVSFDSNIDNSIDSDVNTVVEKNTVNDASSIDVENESESVLKDTSLVVGMGKVMYDETGRILVKPKRQAVVKVRAPRKNNSKSFVVPPSEVVGGSLISVLVPSDAIVSSDNVSNLVHSDQTVLSDDIITLAPSDNSNIVESLSGVIASDKNVSVGNVSVSAPSETSVHVDCVSIPSDSIVCSKQKTAVKRVRKKKQSDITPVPVTESVETADSITVHDPSEPIPKKKAAPRKRPPRKKKSEISNATSENNETAVLANNSSASAQDANIVQMSSETGVKVKSKAVAKKRPPGKKQSVDKCTPEEDSKISVSNSFLLQENSNSLQQFCAEISLNSFGNDQSEDMAVQNSYSEQCYNDSRSMSTDFVSMSSSTGLMDSDMIQGSSNSLTLGSDFVQGINNSNQLSGDLTHNSYIPGFNDCRPMTSEFVAGSVSDNFVQGAYHHSSQMNNDVVEGSSEILANNYNFASSSHNNLKSDTNNLAQMDCNSYQIGCEYLEMNRDSSTNVSHTVLPSTDCSDSTAEVMNCEGDISSWLAASMGL